MSVLVLMFFAGHFLTTESDIGIEGDIYLLNTSPLLEEDNLSDRCLSFDLYIVFDPTSHVNALQLLYNDHDLPHKIPTVGHILNISSSKNIPEWKRFSVPLPFDYPVLLSFKYFMGYSYHSVAAVDNLQVEDCSDSNDTFLHLSEDSGE